MSPNATRRPSLLAAKVSLNPPASPRPATANLIKRETLSAYIYDAEDEGMFGMEVRISSHLPSKSDIS